MSFTYTGAPSTATPTGRRDAVRLLLKDLSSGTPLYQDSEIEFFLTHFNSNVWRAAAYASIGLAAREADSKSVGDLSISGFGKSWRQLSADYHAHADAHTSLYAGGISVSDKQTAESDTDRTTPSFTRTLFENPQVPDVVPAGTRGGLSS